MRLYTPVYKLFLFLLVCLYAVSVRAEEERPYLQIAVTSDKAAAENIRQQLDSAGFDAEQRRVESVGRKVFVVLVGPYERATQASYDQRRLRDIGWPATIKRYILLPKPKPSSVRATVSGSVAVELRHFDEDALYSTEQLDNTASMVLQPEFFLGWNKRKSSLIFTPFVRVGDKDEERNHADVRELMWLTVMGDWELRLGVGKVFWGVTESLHLVDIINQVDLVENPDGEDKLGQPMVNINWFNDWGNWELFALPLFRERTFSGVEGRLRGPLVVDTEQDALYESEDMENHLDWALRWSHYIGSWDIGLSHFSGTSRTPEFVGGLNSQGQAVLVPRYNLLQQTGLTLQGILGDLALKLEAISSEERDSHYTAAVAGLEYTHVGLFGSGVDVGLLLEYLYDDRGDASPSQFEDDVMLGLRWVLNDMQSTEILMGIIRDRESSANTAVTIEASRRLGQSWKLALEHRGSSGFDEPADPGYLFRNDDYTQLELSYFF